MAELVLRLPGQPERVVPLPAGPCTIGRSDDCTVQIAERKASRRHCRLEPGRPGPDGAKTWILTDLGSSNGTVVGEDRVLRRALVAGDCFRVGDTEVEVRDAPVARTESGTPVLVLSGALAPEAPAPAAPAPAPTAPSGSGEVPSAAGASLPPDEGTAEGPTPAEVARAALKGRRAIARGVVGLVLASVALVGVQVGLGRLAEQRGAAAGEASDYERLLSHLDGPPDRVQADLRSFLRDHPTSRHRPDLERVLAAREAEASRLAEIEAALDAAEQRVRAPDATDLDESLARLLALRAKTATGTPLDARFDLALRLAVERRDEALSRARAAAEAEADAALARGDAAAAIRRMAALEASRATWPPAVAEAIAAKRRSLVEAAGRLADEVVAKAQAQPDPDLRRAALLAALKGLGGLPEADRVRSALLGVSGGTPVARRTDPGTAPRPPSPPTPSAPRPPAPAPTPEAPPDLPLPPMPGAVPPTPPAGPETGLPSPALLAQAADAERLARERKWAEASLAFGALAASDVVGRVKTEWAERAADLARVARLPEDLAAAVAAGGERPPRAKVEGASCEILGADAAGARVRRAEQEATLAWGALSPADLLAVLSAGKVGPERHLGLALLAAELGDRPAAVAHLAPLVEGEALRAEAFRVMARRVEGRLGVPEGGYRPLDGDLVDRETFERRTAAKAVAALEAEAGELVRKVAADPAFRALEKVRARRDELDRRRAYALLAIFNEKHWPYPHDDPKVAKQYEVVTAEVDRRWKLVKEVWDEGLKARAPAGGAVEKAVARHAAACAEIEAKGGDPAALRAAMAPYALWLGAGEVSVREYFRDEAERDLLAYNRWVVEQYNPTRTAVAADPEREQVRITNEYRAMMGWQFFVAPGPAAYEDVTRENVVAILDAAKEAEGKARVGLRAVRVDDRLVGSARAHSVDMERRGFFSHFAPPNPATGEPQTSPFDRIQKAGYAGQGASENIAMAGSALDAHLRWLRSSGHHRNILTAWDDLGVGLAGNRWTQNFGLGGGGAFFVPGKPDRTPEPGAEGGR